MRELSDLQRGILAALRTTPNSSLGITRIGPDVIQVSVSEKRWFGKAAISAVMNLMVHGLLTRVGGQKYELTESGVRVAGTLSGRTVAAPRRGLSCPRCHKRLVSGRARCGFCGARVATPPAAAAPDA